MPKELSPVLLEKDGIFTATFTMETGDPFAFAHFALAFVRAAANNKPKLPVAVLKLMGTQPVLSPEDLSRLMTEATKKSKLRVSRFRHLVNDAGDWVFIWVCYPYCRTIHDDSAVPALPKRTVITLTAGKQGLKLEISGGRQTSVIRRAQAGMGRHVPFAWKTTQGLEPHPQLDA